MKKRVLFSVLSAFTLTMSVAQVATVVNYDFNSASAYPLPATATATGVTCSATSSEAFQVYTGVATGTLAFTNNSNAGNALAMANSGGTNTRNFIFQLGGSDLANYKDYKLYLQSQRSSTGATLITVAYSTDGTSYTNFGTTYPVTTAFGDVQADLSAISAINNSASVYIKLMVSGASATTGTFRIDNFQVQANRATGSGGTGGTPWTVTGNDVSFPGKLNVAGDATFAGSLNAASLLLGSSTTAIKVLTGSNGNKYVSLDAEPTSADAFATASSGSQYCWMPIGGTIVKELTVLAPMTTALENHVSIQTDKINGYISLVHPSTFGSNSGPGILKINESCLGDVNIAKGGGVVNTGPRVEIGTVTRDAFTALNMRLPSSLTKAIQVADATGKINFLVKATGYVYAREINVMPTGTPFPDYVFFKGYKLLPLSELENYVNRNKHLPNIPSAAEVEDKGINLAEMQIKQMEKIEELYLYIIELKKENEALKKRIDALDKN